MARADGWFDAHWGAAEPLKEPTCLAGSGGPSNDAIMSIRPESLPALRPLAEVIANFASGRNR